MFKVRILPRVNNCIYSRKRTIISTCCKISLISVTMLSRKGNCIRNLHRFSFSSPRLDIHSCPNCILLIEGSGKWCFICHHIFGTLFALCFICHHIFGTLFVLCCGINSCCCVIKFIIRCNSCRLCYRPEYRQRLTY